MGESGVQLGYSRVVEEKKKCKACGCCAACQLSCCDDVVSRQSGWQGCGEQRVACEAVIVSESEACNPVVNSESVL